MIMKLRFVIVSLNNAWPKCARPFDLQRPVASYPGKSHVSFVELEFQRINFDTAQRTCCINIGF